jgi:hypothetical protein
MWNVPNVLDVWGDIIVIRLECNEPFLQSRWQFRSGALNVCYIPVLSMLRYLACK